MSSSDDPLERLWGSLYVGDAPGNRVLLSDTQGRCAVVEYRPDGGSAPRTVLIGGERLTFDAPTLAEGLLSEGVSLLELADDLQARWDMEGAAEIAAMTPQQRAKDRDRDAAWARFQARQAAEEAATVRRCWALGRLDVWLRSQPDPDGVLAAVADGRDHRCWRCDGTGQGLSTPCSCLQRGLHVPVPDRDPDPDCVRCGGTGKLPEPCLRCAGSGMRRSAGTLIVADERGGRYKLHMDASKVELEEETTVPPVSSGRVSWSLYRMSIAYLADELRTAGLEIPDEPAVLLQAGTRTTRFDGTKVSYGHAEAGGVAGAFLRLLSGGVRPDLAPSWVPERTRQLSAAECRFDPQGRAEARLVRIRPVRPLAAAWAELVDHAAALAAALPDGWQVQVWLSTAFIATGQHGPRVQLVAIPPEVGARTIEAVGAVESSLGDTVETVVGLSRTAAIEQIAQDVLTTGR